MGNGNEPGGSCSIQLGSTQEVCLTAELELEIGAGLEFHQILRGTGLVEDLATEVEAKLELGAEQEFHSVQQEMVEGEQDLVAEELAAT